VEGEAVAGAAVEAVEAVAAGAMDPVEAVEAVEAVFAVSSTTFGASTLASGFFSSGLLQATSEVARAARTRADMNFFIFCLLLAVDEFVVADGLPETLIRGNSVFVGTPIPERRNNPALSFAREDTEIAGSVKPMSELSPLRDGRPGC
jgi:hypothetical protein